MTLLAGLLACEYVHKVICLQITLHVFIKVFLDIRGMGGVRVFFWGKHRIWARAYPGLCQGSTRGEQNGPPAERWAPQITTGPPIQIPTLIGYLSFLSL